MLNRCMKSKEHLFLEHRADIEKWIANKEPLYNISRFMGVKQSTLVKYLRKMGMSYSGQQGWLHGKENLRCRVPVEKFLTDNGPYINASRLRSRLIRDGIKKEQCEKCHRTEWEGGRIPLELHHVDKNRFNNKLENLLVLCSNCHMQIHEHSNVKRNK